MAQIKHNHFLDTVDEVINEARAAGVLHLEAEDQELTGRFITINEVKCCHFGTTGYLGLEQDTRIKASAIAAIERYGTQFPLSKTYISHPLYSQLENKLEELYGYPVIITKNSTLGHLAVIPTVVGDQDAILLDHQVHWSVQQAAQQLKVRGVPVQLVRHNNLEMLENMIQKLSPKVEHIWYMADGVYSMFGDYAPVQQLVALGEKYPQLHLYFDDVHGMSWKGTHGRGYVMSQLQTIPERVLIFGTLSKTFGASGAVLVCSNKRFYQRIKNFGGPLTFSAQLEPSAVGAAIASAAIHLSPEIYKLQEALQDRITYFNALLAETDLLLPATNDSPVFFIATGIPETGYALVRRLLKAGFFVNLGLFPAVPVKNTGVRITISIHNTKEDIAALVNALVKHYPKALEETSNNKARIAKAFNLKRIVSPKGSTVTDGLDLHCTDSILNLDRDLWNKSLGQHNMLDWEGLRFLEQCFKRPEASVEHYWKFYYIQIFDYSGTLVLCAFLTQSIWKNDMLSPESVSKKIELLRKEEPYAHTSPVLALGSVFTEGNHLYQHESHPQRQAALLKFLLFVEELSHQKDVALTALRDFDKSASFLGLFQQQGYLSVAMPDSCIVTNLQEKRDKPYWQYLSTRSQKHYKKDIAPYEELVEIRIALEPTSDELIQFYELYKQVKDKNIGLNTFTYPIQVFEEMGKHPNWEFICLYSAASKKLVGVMFCYKNERGVYVPNLVGLDYNHLNEFAIYRQLLYQTLIRAQELGYNQVDFGFSASFEKKKLGAQIIPKLAFLQTDDNFILEDLEMMRVDA